MEGMAAREINKQLEQYKLELINSVDWTKIVNVMNYSIIPTNYTEQEIKAHVLNLVDVAYTTGEVNQGSFSIQFINSELKFSFNSEFLKNPLTTIIKK